MLLMFSAQNAERASNGRRSKKQELRRYMYACGILGCTLCHVVGPPGFWLSCVPCIASPVRREIRRKYGLEEYSCTDFGAHCLW